MAVFPKLIAGLGVILGAVPVSGLAASAVTHADARSSYTAPFAAEAIRVDGRAHDAARDPLVQYWDDDCLEIFLDEDYSGGDHQYNHNAFAYHMSLDNQAIDIGTDHNAQNYSHHVSSNWRQHGNTVVWEVAIDIYDDSYVDSGIDNKRLSLMAGKVLGLMVAYCDNDGSELRENFVGSESVPTGPKDRGWIDAGLFGEVVLDE